MFLQLQTVESTTSVMDERIDPFEVLPPEICLRIFDYLNAEDLCRCLAVSHQWRCIANTDKYWRSFCHKRGLDPSLMGANYVLELLPLCASASCYISYMNRLVSNWAECRFHSFHLNKEDWCCCIAGHQKTLAVYYPRSSFVQIYHITNSIEPLCDIQVPVPYGMSIPDVLINEHYLVVTKGNVLMVYKNNVMFTLYKVIVGLENGLKISCNLFSIDDTDKRMYVKVITKNTIWLESDALYVVDIVSDSYRVLVDSFRCLRVYEDRIYAANDAVTCYNPNGEKLYGLKIKYAEDMWVRDKVMVILTGDLLSQKLQVWNLHSKSMQCNIIVHKNPTVSISPDLHHLFVLEIIEDMYTISCFSTQTGTMQWTFEHVFGRDILIHPEIRIVCDKFIFARPSYTCDRNFILLSSKSGRVLYDSTMPPCLSPPCYIYHLSDEFLATAETNKVHIRSYV